MSTPTLHDNHDGGSFHGREMESGNVAASTSESFQAPHSRTKLIAIDNFVFRQTGISGLDHVDLFEATKMDYLGKFRMQADATDTREGRDNIIVHERLLSIVKKVEEATNLNEIMRVHRRHSKSALVTAHEMLRGELVEYEKCAKRMINLNDRGRFTRSFIRPLRVRVRKMEESILWCNRLESDISEGAQSTGPVYIEID